MTHALELVTARLTDVTGYTPPRETGDWRCPAHDDGRPSLSVSNGDGKVLLHCQAGCALDAIVEALRLTKADLFDEPTMRSDRPEIVARYPYVDETGTLLFEVVRLAPKGFRQRRPDGNGGWIWKLGDTRRVLYRLPQVLQGVADGQSIFVVEGEKDVAALEAAGEVATCNPGGAGKWRPEYSEAMRGAAEVIIVADRDAAGFAHADQVAASLRGIVDNVVMAVPLDRAKDIADHLAAGHTVDELEVVNPVESPTVDAEPPSGEEKEFGAVERFESALISFDDMERRPPPEYLVDRVLVRNSLAVMFGPPGIGKSFVVADVLAHVAIGAWWQGRRVEQGDVLAVAAEGVGGLPQRVAAWKKHNRTYAVPGYVIYPHAVNLLDAGQVEVLVEVCRRRRFALVAIDTVARSMPGGDENSAKDMGLAILAADRIRNACSGACVLLVHHTGKDAAAGMRGSSSLEGAADTVMEVKGGEGAVELVCKKQKDAGQFQSIQLSLAVVEVTVCGVDTTSCAVTGRERTSWVPEGRVEEAKAVLVQLLSSTGLPSTAVRDAIEEKLGVRKTAAYDL